MIWIFIDSEGDGIKSRPPFKIFSTLTSERKANWWLIHVPRRLCLWVVCMHRFQLKAELHRKVWAPSPSSSLHVSQPHSDFKWLKLTGNKFIQSDFTSFNKKCFCKFTLLPFPSLPGLQIQICQIIAVTVMILQLHEFFESGIWRVFDNWPNCEPASSSSQSAPFPSQPAQEFCGVEYCNYIVLLLRTVGQNRKTRQRRVRFKKFVKSTNHPCACNDLTSFECEAPETGNGSYVNLQKLPWKNSWNHLGWIYILADFWHLELLWYGF
jgi:hypothetical protein